MAGDAVCAVFPIHRLSAGCEYPICGFPSIFIKGSDDRADVRLIAGDADLLRDNADGEQAWQQRAVDVQCHTLAVPRHLRHAAYPLGIPEDAVRDGRIILIDRRRACHQDAAAVRCRAALLPLPQ